MKATTQDTKMTMLPTVMKMEAVTPSDRNLQINRHSVNISRTGSDIDRVRHRQGET